VSTPIDQALRYPAARGLTPLGRHPVVEDQCFVGLVADEDDGLCGASQHALDLDERRMSASPSLSTFRKVAVVHDGREYMMQFGHDGSFCSVIDRVLRSFRFT